MIVASPNPYFDVSFLRQAYDSQTASTMQKPRLYTVAKCVKGPVPGDTQCVKEPVPGDTLDYSIVM